MPHFVQSFETGRWCIEHQGYDIEEGMVVAFPNVEQAAYFVEQGRAGYIGEYPTMEHAFERLAEIIESQKAAEAADAAARATAVANNGTDPAGSADPATAGAEAADAAGGDPGEQSAGPETTTAPRRRAR